MNHEELQVVMEAMVSAICVIAAFMAAVVALEWSGIWSPLLAVGLLPDWLAAQPGPLRFAAWLGCAFSLGWLLVLASRGMKRALFRS